MSHLDYIDPNTGIPQRQYPAYPAPKVEPEADEVVEEGAFYLDHYKDGVKDYSVKITEASPLPPLAVEVAFEEGEKTLPPPVEPCDEIPIPPIRSTGWWNHFKARQDADRKKIEAAIHAINDQNTHKRHQKQIWKLQQLLTQANGVIACRVLDLEEKQGLIEAQEECIQVLHGDVDEARESIRQLRGRIHVLQDRVSSLKRELKQCDEDRLRAVNNYYGLLFEPLYTSIWRWLRRKCWR